MSVRRLAYVVNARLPTEKAHGVQIAKMCEAFASLGVDVTLFSPRRHQVDESFRRQTLAAFYAIRHPVRHELVPNIDVVRAEHVFPRSAYTALFFTHAMLWSAVAARRAARSSADLFFTRDVPVAYSLARLGRPTVLELHSVPRGARRLLLMRLARSRALRGVVTLTSFSKADLMPLGFAGVPIAVMPDGVDLECFGDAPSSAECRQRLGLPAGTPLVGYAGAFNTIGQEKGIATLVHALKRIRSEPGLRDATLVCVGGDGAERAAYMALAHEHGLPASALMLYGRVPHHEVPAWLRACDVLTIPFPDHRHFAYYASPLKLFEYMAAGGAIVASDLPSLREVLEHGRNALLVPPSNEAALAAAIVRLLRDAGLRDSCVTHAARDAARYGWVERARRLLETFGSASAHSLPRGNKVRDPAVLAPV
jgi:glycosyltransferase involved in cell wall biosynthesis